MEYFTRSGSVALNSGSLRDASYRGHYWSSTAYPDVNNAYSLFFYSANTYPSYYDARSFGYSARCSVVITRSGLVDLNTGSLRRVGLNGHYWSSTAYPDVNNAYSLGFNSDYIYPSNYGTRSYGGSVLLFTGIDTS